jgi:hypothetical protein
LSEEEIALVKEAVPIINKKPVTWTAPGGQFTSPSPLLPTPNAKPINQRRTKKHSKSNVHKQPQNLLWPPQQMVPPPPREGVEAVAVAVVVAVVGGEAVVEGQAVMVVDITANTLRRSLQLQKRQTMAHMLERRENELLSLMVVMMLE